jgi:subtilisin family serine protease
MNGSLHRAVTADEVSEDTVSLLLQGDVTIAAAAVKALGGKYKYAVGNIASVILPLNRVMALSQTEGIEKIEGLHGPGSLMDDMTNINSNVNPVHFGYAPLAQPYTGNGVVMAFLDSGIEWSHPDFQKSDGTTRIRWLWDQNMFSGGTEPEEFGYGQEWDSAAIDNGECTHAEWGGYYGHGSNVTGIGAGNGLAVGNYIGVAPHSDIISIAVKFDNNFLINVADATKYAFDKAAAIGKPCVINASLGTYAGSHDGTDLAAQLIDALIEEQNGRTFVCAAGNAGNIKFHLGYEAEPDSAFTWFYYSNYTQSVSFEWWIDKVDAAGFNFSIGADITVPYTYWGRTDYYNLVSDFDYSNGVATKKDTLFYNSTRLGIVTFTAHEYETTYECDVTIKPDLTTYYWRFITRGSGSFDCWSGSTTIGSSDMITAIPDEATFPDIARYRLPDNNKTIVSSFTCSDKVITVGNYNNRNQYIDYYGHLQTNSNIVGALGNSSSLGPTRDGRIKPEITAPGNTTLSAGQFATLYGLLIYQPYKVGIGGLHNTNGGTSMASPVVAGVAAMYLEKNPEASWKEVKAAITSTARMDSITGYSLPDNKFGYGRVDAFEAMTTAIELGCTDPFSVNFDPAATVDDGSCIPIVFGCTDVSALNYDSAATVNDGSCEYLVGINPFSDNEIYFLCSPNPSSSIVKFYFGGIENSSGSRIIIRSLEGRVVDEIILSPGQSTFTYITSMAGGLYLCEWQADGIHSKALKLFVQ